MAAIGPYAGLAGRVMMALIFVLSGAAKLADGEAQAAMVVSVGLPGFLVYAAGALELFGGIAVIVGFQTRIAALLLAGFSVVAALLFHNQFADQMQMVMFLKNIAMAGGLLFLVRDGAGAYSMDARSGA